MPTPRSQKQTQKQRTPPPSTTPTSASTPAAFTLTGAQVRDLRLSVGATQVDLARALGYNRSAISRWERRPTTSIPRTQYERVLTYLAERRATNDRLHELTDRLTTQGRAR